MAHSAYPELGESAIDKLVAALHDVQKLELPYLDGIGESTLNVGLISGGRAPNVMLTRRRHISWCGWSGHRMQQRRRS